MVQPPITADARRSRRVISAALAVTTLATSVLVASPAFADDALDDGIASALAAVPAEHGVLQDLATDPAGSAEIPTDPSDGLILNSTRGVTLEVALPFAGTAADAVDIADSAVAYDNGNGSSTVPTAKSDGSVQITTVIQDADAPTSYEYGIGSAGGTSLRLFEDGSVVIEDAAGVTLGGVVAPWAYDAEGTPVKTWYEVDGSSLVQVVAHDADSYAYPIVADPWLGINLFSWITVDSYNSQPRVNLQPSPWGAAQWASIGGQIVMNTAGWDEAWNWNSTVRSGLNKDSQRQQFECHSLGSPFAGTWNLEKFRPNRTVHWSAGVAIHHCNWTTPTLY
ncbi:hypothetical protein [Herbiconiux ginsengi]|uniref:DUF2599 domain-containing protein n=1 Tax=Herbiconiux ginsengi TaxID=381665 RepID=A0A1H3TYZ1_9MICO|nr:hypothetical protein [Herbiconiux ginsengi]SDZ55298.1 hypothetical protein SAMN05216554_4587 [Herbiconiux ginsengi]